METDQNTSHTSYDHTDYLNRDEGLVILEVIYLVTVSIIGTFGNSLVICTVLYKRISFKNANIFVVNLALVDLMVTGVLLPIMTGNVVENKNILGDGTLCNIAGFMITVGCNVSIWSLAAIALNRYFCVNHSARYRKTVTKAKLLLATLFVWLYALVVSSFTWDESLGAGLWYDEKMQLCSWRDNGSLAFTTVFVIVCVLIPMAAIIFSYVSLFRHVLVTRRNVTRRMTRTISNLSMRKSRERRVFEKNLALLKTLAVTVILFLLCWLPYITVCFVQFAVEDLNSHLKKFTGIFALTNSCINCIIYGLMNPVYRKGYKEFCSHLLHKLNCCGWKICGSAEDHNTSVNYSFGNDSSSQTTTRRNTLQSPTRSLASNMSFAVRAATLRAEHTPAADNKKAKIKTFGGTTSAVGTKSEPQGVESSSLTECSTETSSADKK